MKIKAKFINGSWINDDIDLIPTVKLRTGNKTNSQTQLIATATSLAFCWLKWGFIISIGRVEEIKLKNMYPQDMPLPITLITRQDFETVLSYFLLPEHYELRVVDDGSIDCLISLEIFFKQPLLSKRIKLAKKYIEEHKPIYIEVKYR